MTSLTSSTILPELTEVYSLYKTYTKNKTADVKITDLFLVKTSQGHFEFVKKKSFKGQWLRVLDWCENKLGIGKDRFVIEKSFAKIQEHFQKIFAEISMDDANKLNELADALGVVPDVKTGQSKADVLRENLYGLGIELQNLMYGIEKSRLEKLPEGDRTFKPLPELRLFERKIEDSYTQAQKNVAYQKVKAAIGKHITKPDQLDAITNVVIASSRKDQILEDLSKNDKTSLVTTLREALRGQVSEKDHKALHDARCSLAPLTSDIEWDETQVQKAVTLFCSSFVKEQKEEGLASIQATTLKFLDSCTEFNHLKPLLEHAVLVTKDTQLDDLKAKIEAAMNKTDGSCLLLGGDPKNVSVSRITRQSDGSYTVRVYNQEPKRELPADVKKEEVVLESGYHEFRNISEAKLFSKDTPSIWSRLQFWKVQENEGVGYIQHLLRPELPGTSASKSLSAALVHDMDQKDAARFQFEYDMHLLGIIELQLTALSSQDMPSEYHAIRKTCSEIKAAVDQFAKNLEGLDTNAQARGHDKILLFYDLLDRLDARLVESEKKLYTEKLASLSIQTSPLTFAVPTVEPVKAPPSQVKTSSIQAIPMENRDLEVFQAIHAMKLPNVADTLSKLSNMDPKSVYFIAACDSFCKKIGSLNAWDTIPVDAAPLQTLFENIVNSIDPTNSDKANARCYGSAVFIMYGLEAQFRKVSHENRVLPETFPSSLSCEDVLMHVNALRTSDPFWAKCFADILKGPEQAPVLDVSLSKKGDFQLSTVMESSIHSWLTASPMGKRITDSIKNDRAQQEQLIQQQVAAKKAEKAQAESQKSVCEKQKITLEKTITEKTGQVRTLEEQIKQKEKQRDDAQAERSANETEISTLRQTLTTKKEGPKGSRQTRFGGFKEYFVSSKTQKEIDDLEKQISAKQTEIDSCNARYVASIQELNKLNPQKKELTAEIAQNRSALTDIVREIDTLTSAITECDKEINGGIRNRIQNDPQYWPWGIGQEGGWTPEQVASFYFATGHSDIFQRKLGVADVFSKEFRAHINAYMIATNLFHKTQGSLTLPITIGLTSSKSLSLSMQHAVFGDPIIPDLYTTQIKNPIHNALYTALYSKQYIDEANIPRYATVDLQKAVEAQSSLLAQAIERIRTLIPRRGTKIVLDDELRELCQLHVSDKIQIDATVSFFQENPKKLLDADARYLLHALLFEKDLLLQKLTNETSRDLLVARLAQLFKSGITSAIELGDLESAVDIALIAATAQSQLDAAAPRAQNKIYKHEQLLSLFETVCESKDTRKWPALVEALVAASHHLLPENLETDQDKKLFIYAHTARAMSKQIEIQPEERNAIRRQDADTAELALKERLGQMQPSVVGELLNQFAPRLLSKAYPKLLTVQYDADPSQQGIFTSKDKKTTLSLTTGSLVSTDPGILKIEKNPLPKEVSDTLLSQNFYPDQSSMYGLHCSTQGSIVTVNDDRRALTIEVDLKANRIRVKARDPMPWCQHLAIKVDCKNSLLMRYTEWLDPETKKLYLIDPQTFQVCYESEGTHFIDSKSKLCVLAPPTDSLFSSFEEPSCTLYRGDASGNIKEIQFLRLGLTLVKNASGSWEQAGVKNWVVATEQYIPHLEQKTGFLVLENSQTKEKKALFPMWDLQIQGNLVGYQFNTETATARSLEYSIQDTKLVAKDPLSRYFLAKLFFAKANLEQAEELLYSRVAEVSSRKLTNEEMHELKQIALNPAVIDTSPRAIRLRMHALYLLKRNEAQFPKEPLKEEPRPEIGTARLKDVQAQIQLVALYQDRVQDTSSLAPFQEQVVLESLDRQIKSLKDTDKNQIDLLLRTKIQRSIARAEVNASPVAMHANLEDLLVIRKVPHDAAMTREFAREYFTVTTEKGKKTNLSDLFSLTSPEIKDAVTRGTFEEIAKDLQVAQSTLQEPAVQLNEGKDLRALQKILEDSLKLEENLLANEETQIVNAVAEKLTGPYQGYPTIDELCVLCARKEYDAFTAAHYPMLSKEDRIVLKEAVQKYLFQKEAVQQLKRSISLIKAYHTAPDQMKMPLMQSIAFSLKQTRAYPPEHKLAMAFLIIETSLNIKLRPDQVQNILKFDQGILQNKELVLQMIMGAGKTSVIQPILALLLAKPDVLSCVMVPEAQFQSVRDKLQQTLGMTFDKALISFPYDRELSDDLAFLSATLENLTQAKESGACVLLAPRQKHSILTSLYEAYYNLSRKEETVEELQKKIEELQKAHQPEKVIDLQKQLQEIQSGKLEARVDAISKISKFLGLHEFDQIDEIDMIMNPKVVFKRPIGVPEVFDQQEGFARSTLLADILLDLANDPTIAKEVSIDFIDKYKEIPPEKKAQAIDETLYRTKVQPKLVEIACEHLKKDKTLKALLETHPDEIKHFLTQTASDTKSLEDIQKFVSENVTDQRSQQLLASCTHAIAHVLPVSLLEECNSHYGKDPAIDATGDKRQFVARPYEAPHAPKKTTYADPHKKILYSIQYFLFAGITLDTAKEMLIRWQEEARHEMQTQARPSTQTTRYEQFRDLVGPNFFTDPNSPEFTEVATAFQKAAKTDRAVLLEFFQTQLFKQVKVYNKDITSTPQTLVGSSNQASGYTGTMHTGILSSSMKGIAEIGTDGKTIAAVQEKIINGQATIEVVNERQKPLTQQIIDMFNKDLSVFIDSGGWLKEQDIDAFAKIALKQCNRSDIEGIVYHDKNDKLVCLEKGSDKPVPFEHSRLKNSSQNRLTIIAQKYETGTDISQTPNAKAYMSIRKNMTLRDALQSIFRMRQVLQGQIVSIGMTEDVKNHIGSALFESLLSKGLDEFFTDNAELDFVEKLDELQLPQDIYDACVKAEGSYNSKEFYKRSSKQERIGAFVECFLKVYTPDSTSFWRYAAANQAQSHMDKNWAAANYRMKETLEKPLRNVLTDPALSQENRLALFTHMESVFVHTELDTLFQSLCSKTEEKSAQDIVQEQIKSLMHIYEKSETLPPELVQRIQTEIASCYLEETVKAVLLTAQLSPDNFTDDDHKEFLRLLKNGLKQFTEKQTTLNAEELKDFQKELPKLQAELVDNCMAKLDKEKRLALCLAVINILEIDDKGILESTLNRCVDYSQIPEKMTVKTALAKVEIEIEAERQEQETEAEHEKQTETERLVESEILTEKVMPPEKRSYQPLFRATEAYYDINAFFNTSLSPVKQIVPKSLQQIEGLDSFEYSKNLFLEPGEIGSARTASYHLASRFLLALSQSDGSKRFIFVSHEDAARIEQGFSKSTLHPPLAACLYDLMGNCIAGERFNDQEMIPVLAKAKLATLHTNFTHEEIKAVGLMLKKSRDPIGFRQAWLTFYQSGLRHFPTQAQNFKASNIERYLMQG